MNWIAYPEFRPDASGPYLVSLTRPYGNGDFTFNYVAYYDAENNRWHKYDAFVEDSVGERINLTVNGWVGGVGNYLG